jgi:hypothetical protein
MELQDLHPVDTLLVVVEEEIIIVQLVLQAVLAGVAMAVVIPPHLLMDCPEL